MEAFDAPDAPVLDLPTITAVPEDAWPSARLVLQPSVQRLALRHPAHEVRIAVRSGEPLAATGMTRPAPSPTYVVVFRGPTRLQCIALEADAYALLDELAHGTALGDACERIATASGASSDSFEEKVSAWFQEWTALGWLSRVARD